MVIQNGPEWLMMVDITDKWDDQWDKLKISKILLKQK